MAERIGLEAVFDMSNFNSGMSKYMDATGKASGVTEKAAGGMGKAWTSLGDTASKAAAIMGGAVVAASVAAGAAIAGFTVQGIQKAADLEEGLSRIAAALNITMEQVGPLKELITNLGLDPNLKVTAVEAAQAIENLAKNGLSMDQILNGAARSTVLLANATGADFGQAADIATDVMAQFNIKAEDMDQVVNGITATTNLSKFSIDDYALALSQGGGVASSVGMEFDDFNTTIAAISPLFASGSDAGTALKTMMLRLAPSTAPAAEAMGELGLMTFDTQKAMAMLAEAGITPVSDSFNDVLDSMIQYYGEAYNVDVTTQEGIDKFGKWSNEIDLMSNAFFDANGNLKDMSEISAILYEATKDLTEEQKNQYMNTIFGTDAMRAAFATAESGAVVYTDAALAAKELGVSQEEVNKVIEGGVTQFEALQLQMGMVDANEQAKTRMDNFKGAMEILSGVIESVQIQIGDAFLPILTELAKQFTALASQYGPLVVEYFQGLATSISDLIRYVGEFIATGQPFNQFFADLSPSLQNAVLGIGGFVLLVQQASDLIANSIGRFVEWKDVLIVLGATIATAVIPALVAMIAAMVPAIAIFAAAVVAVAALRTAWENDFLGIKTTTLAVFDAITKAIQPLIDAFKNFGAGALAEIKAFVTGNQTEFTNLNAIWEGAKTSANNLFTSISSYAATNLPTWRANLIEWGTAAAQWVVDAHVKVVQNLASWSTAIIGYATANLPTWKAALTEWTTAAWQWLVDAAGQVSVKLAAWYANLSASLSDKLAAWKTAFVAWATASWQWIVDAAGQVGAKVATWFTNLKSAIDAKLPAWKTAFAEWAVALTSWLANSITNVTAAIDQWFSQLKSRLAEKLPQWKTELLKFATVMVTWIGDKAADAIPALGTWLGKIVAWIPLGVLALGKAIVQMAGALVGWIAGGGETDKSASAAGQTDAAMAEFQAALMDALAKVGQAFVVAVQAFVDEFAKTMREHVNWEQVGSDILNGVRTGWESVKQAVIDAVTSLIDGMVAIITDTDWKGLGSDIVDYIKDGVSSVAGQLVNYMGEMASDAARKFIDFDWAGLGSDIVSGILKGLKDNGSQIVDYLYSLGEQALDKIKAFFGISSPSKVMADVGKDIVLGLVVGMQKTAPDLYKAIDAIVNKVLDGFEAASSLGGSFASAGGGFASRVKQQIDALLGTEGGPTPEQQAQADALQEQLSAFERQKDAADLLKDQASLFALVQKEGGDLSQLFGGITVGLTANANDFMNIVAGAMQFLNERTDKALRIAVQGYDKLIAQMANKRQKVADVEAEFAEKSIDQLDQYKNHIALLDKEIADTEASFLTSGNKEQFQRLESLNEIRQDAINGLRTYLRQLQEIERIGAQAQADDPILGPLLNRRNDLLARFKDVNAEEQERVDILKEYTGIVTRLAGLQGKLDQTGFLDQQQQLLQSIKELAESTGDNDLMRRIFYGIKPTLGLSSENLTTVYERFVSESMGAAQKQLYKTLDEIEAQIVIYGNQYDKQIAEMRSRRRTIEEIEAKFQDQKLGGLEAYRKRITDLDAKIAEAEANVLSTGSLEQFKLLNQYNQFRSDAVANLEAYLQRSLQAERIVGRIQSASNDRMQTAIDAFKASAIDPLMASIADFSLANNVANLDSVNRALNERVNMIDAYLASADDLAEVERRATALLDDNDLGSAVEESVSKALDALYDVGTLNRDNLLSSLSNYIAQAQRAFEGFNAVVGDDPLMARIRDSVKPLLNQLLDINLAAAERNRLTVEYNVAIRNMLAMESKQGQLSAINDRLALVEKVRSVANELKDPNLFARVLSGVDITKNLSAQDLATVLSRYTDEAIRLANKQLSQALTPPIDIQSQLDALAKGRRNFDAILSGMTGSGISQLEDFRTALERYDTQIADLEKKALETNSQAWVDVIATLTNRRREIQVRTEKLVGQMNRANRMLETIATTNNQEAQAVADSWRAKYIDPMIEQLDAIGSDAEKEGLLGALGTRINTLNRYIAQVGRLDAIKKDVSGITGFSPLVARWEETHLDRILNQIYSINTAEAQRNVLIEQYRAEQEKLVALQQKQQQLEFLQQQLALVDQLHQMNQEFDDIVSVENLLSGITFGINASLDDMLLLTSRTIDTMILTVKRQLGIASPSKVMARIGEQMMAGLGTGIRNAAQYPAMAMARVNQQVPYALTNSRTLNVNMGGVNISNGMDDVLFEARVRQVVEGMM